MRHLRQLLIVGNNQLVVGVAHGDLNHILPDVRLIVYYVRFWLLVDDPQGFLSIRHGAARVVLLQDELSVSFIVTIQQVLHAVQWQSTMIGSDAAPRSGHL